MLQIKNNHCSDPILTHWFPDLIMLNLESAVILMSNIRFEISNVYQTIKIKFTV